MKILYKKRDRVYARHRKPRHGNICIPPDHEVKPYEFNLEEYNRLRKFFIELYLMKNEPWPNKELWLRLDGCPSYHVEMTNSTGEPCLFIRFFMPVKRPDMPVGSIFRICKNGPLEQKF